MVMKLILSLCIAGVLFFVGASARTYPLRPYELTDLDTAVRYYMVKQLEKNINDTFDEYQSLALQCAGMVNDTADNCKHCIAQNGKKCGPGPSGPGNAAEAILLLVDHKVKGLFGGLGKVQQNLFNNIGNAIGGPMGDLIKGMQNDFGRLTSSISNIPNLGVQFKGLTTLFKGILDGTKQQLKFALEKTQQTFSTITNTIKDTFNKIKDSFRFKLPFLKRSLVIVRERRADMDPCYLRACPVCEKINMSENPTDAQLEQVMSTVCGNIYTQQTAVKKKLERYMELVGELLNNATIVDEFTFTYANRIETMDNFKFTLLGQKKSYTPTTATEIDTRDLTSVGKLISPIILNLIGF